MRERESSGKQSTRNLSKRCGCRSLKVKTTCGICRSSTPGSLERCGRCKASPALITVVQIFIRGIRRLNRALALFFTPQVNEQEHESGQDAQVGQVEDGEVEQGNEIRHVALVQP